MVRNRLRILVALVALAFGALLARLAHLQLRLPESGNDQTLYERARLIPTAPMRGRLLDRSGGVLAENETVFDLYFSLAELYTRELYFAEFQEAFGLCREATPPGYGEMCSCTVLEDALRASLSTLVGTAGAGGRDSGRLGDGSPPWRLVEAIHPARVEDLSGALRRGMAQRGFELRPSGDGGRFELWVDPPSLLTLERTLGRVSALTGAPFGGLLAGVDAAAAALRAPGADGGRRLNPTERRDHRRRRRLLVEDVSKRAVSRLFYHPDRFPGLEVRPRTRRRYPLREAAGIVTGYLANFGGEETSALREAGTLFEPAGSNRRAFYASFLARRDECRFPSEEVGRRGLEAAYDSELRGRFGLRLEIPDADNRPRALEPPIPPLPGTDVTTTLDAELQRELFAALAAVRARGAGVAASAAVMDLRPGAGGRPPGGILAMGCVPTFDPARMRSSDYLRELHALPAELGVLVGRPYRAFLHPGSIFKLVVALAALEGYPADATRPAWALDPATRIECRYVFDERRYPNSFRCNSRVAHGFAARELDLHEALQHSCNTFFYQLGFERLAPEDLWRWGRDFGLGRPVGIDLDLPPGAPARATPTLEPPWRLRRLPLRRRTDILHYCIGQAWVTASPLQVLRATAGLALGGVVPWPWLVTPRTPETVAVRPESLAALREGMRRAFMEPGGTAHGEPATAGFAAAAKTGSAQLSSADRSVQHAWIAGYAPVTDPEIAFVVCIEKSPEGGGDATAPVVGAVLEYFARKRPERFRADRRVETARQVDRSAPRPQSGAERG